MIESISSKQKTLPDDVRQLKNVTRVRLNFSDFTEVPKVLRSLPIELLNMEDSEVREIPQWITDWKNLHTLELGFNQQLNTLPWHLESLEKLETLNLEEAKHLQTIPDSLVDLPDLKYLNIREVPLRGLYPIKNFFCHKHVGKIVTSNLPSEIRDIVDAYNQGSLDACNALKKFYNDSLVDIFSRVIQTNIMTKREFIRFCHEGPLHPFFDQMTKRMRPNIVSELKKCVQHQSD